MKVKENKKRACHSGGGKRVFNERQPKRKEGRFREHKPGRRWKEEGMPIPPKKTKTHTKKNPRQKRDLMDEKDQCNREGYTCAMMRTKKKPKKNSKYEMTGKGGGFKMVRTCLAREKKIRNCMKGKRIPIDVREKRKKVTLLKVWVPKKTLKRRTL